MEALSNIARRRVQAVLDHVAPGSAAEKATQSSGVAPVQAGARASSSRVNKPYLESLLQDATEEMIGLRADAVKVLTTDRMFANVWADNAEEQYKFNLPARRQRVMEQLAHWVEACPWDPRLSTTSVREEALQWVDLSLTVKYAVHFYLFTGSLFLLGTKENQDMFVEDAATFRTPGCFAMTERGHGSNVRMIETTATYDRGSDSFIIKTPTPSAEKYYIGNGLFARRGVVFARLVIKGKDQGPHAFVVDLRDSNGNLCDGVTVRDLGEKQGLNGVDNVAMSFDNVKVPRTHLLAKFGEVDEHGVYSSDNPTASGRFNAMLGALTVTRYTVGIASVSVVKLGLSIALHYAAVRRQFGPDGKREIPIMSYPTTQKRLMPYLSRAYAFQFAMKEVLRVVDNWTNMSLSRELQATVAGLKAMGTWNAIETLQMCRECCGGRGYMAESKISSLRSDFDVFVTFEGDNTVLLQQVAKDMLVQYKREMSGGTFTGVLSFLRKNVVPRAANVFSRHIRTENHLRRSKFHLDAITYRQARMLFSIARSLTRKVKVEGMAAFDAWTSLLPELTDLAKVHVERVTLQAFMRGVQRCKDKPTRVILRDLCSLYGLTMIEQSIGWYFENKVLSPGKGRQIHDQVYKLCASLTPHALDLIDAFGVPKAFLPAMCFEES